MKTMFGELLSFDSLGELNEFIETMDKEEAMSIIDTVLSYCQQNGMFTLEEAHVIYKSLKKIKENDHK